MGHAKMQAARVGDEPFVVVHEPDGYLVYSALTPETTFDVVDSPDGWGCTCDAFAAHANDPEYLCPHLEAVFQAVGTDGGNTSSPPASHPATEHITLKRSVSPDGKIDSLSVECSFPTDGLSSQDTEARTTAALGLLATVVSTFLTKSGGVRKAQGSAPRSLNGSNGRGRTNGAVRSRAHAQDAVEAYMVDIESMDTSRGKCLSLNFEVDGETIKLFGNKKKLARTIRSAGYPDLAAEVTNGLELNVPCLVTLKDSANGDFEQVDRVFPSGG